MSCICFLQVLLVSYVLSKYSMPALVAHLDAPPTDDQEVAGSTPIRSATFLSWRFDYKIFSTVILSLPLIQGDHLLISGERMCTLLVNCLED